MSFVGGDTIEAKVTHPAVGTFTFLFKSDEDCTVDLGGFKSDDDEMGITGSGAFIDKMNRKRASIEFPPVSWEQVGANELDVLQILQDSPILGDWTVANVSGQIYAGKGKPVGDLKGNANTAQIPLTVHFESLRTLN